MSYYGDIRLGDTIDIKFTTRRFTTGAPFTLAGTPVISAYVGNGTTEITAGITLTTDFDSRTGLNNVRIVASSGNGFATATNVQLVITTGTVDSVSVVGEVIGSFSIENRSAVMPTTAGRTLDVSAGGEAGIDFANIGSPTTTVNLSGTTIKTATDVETDTADIQSRIPAALVSGRIDASVGAMAANVLTATAINADAITAAKIANGAIDAATFAADVDAEILSYLVDDATRIDASALNTASVTTIPAILVDTAEIGVAGAGLTNIGTIATVTNLTNLPSIPANWLTAAGIATGAIDADALAADAVTEIWAGSTAPTAGAIADAVWDETLSGHLGAGSTGEALNAAGAAGDPWTTTLPGAYGAGSAGYIIGNNLDAAVSSRSALDAAGVRSAVGLATANLDTQLSALPTDAEIADAVWDEAIAGHAGAGSTGEALAAAGSAGDPWTTALPGAYGPGTAGEIIGDWKNGGRLDLILDAAATQTSVDTVDGIVDAIKLKTDDLNFTVAGQVDANIQYVNDVLVAGTGAPGDEWGP